MESVYSEAAPFRAQPNIHQQSLNRIMFGFPKFVSSILSDVEKVGEFDGEINLQIRA